MSETAVASIRQRPLVLAGIVVGALVLLGLLWVLVLSPGDGAEDETFDPRAGLGAVAQPTEPTDEATEAPVDEVLVGPIETYEIFLSRDPFEPVIPDAIPVAGGDGTDTGGGTGTDGGTTGGGGTDGGTTGGGGTDGGGTTQNAVLIDVFVDDGGSPRATIRVDAVIYTVGEGDTFADGYQVVAITETCVTLTHDGQSFTLCEGGGGGTDGGGGGSGSDPCTGTEEVVCEGRVVSLVDVFVADDGSARAVVQVDTTLYEVGEGDTFAQNFQVLAIDPPCVTLLYGDDAFTLCEGERTLK